MPVSFVEPNINTQKIFQYHNIPMEDVDVERDLCVALVRHKEFLDFYDKPTHFIDIVGLSDFYG